LFGSHTSGKDGEVFVEGLGQPSNKSCIFRNNEANLMTFYEDQQITEDVVEFPPGTELVRIHLHYLLQLRSSSFFFDSIVEKYAIPLLSIMLDTFNPLSPPSPGRLSDLITNVSFFQSLLYTVSLSFGAFQISRCYDIGKFAFTGSVRRRCSRGDWTGMKPACVGLSQENDYARKRLPAALSQKLAE
jgi:hypothetical protein